MFRSNASSFRVYENPTGYWGASMVFITSPYSRTYTYSPSPNYVISYPPHELQEILPKKPRHCDYCGYDTDEYKCSNCGAPTKNPNEVEINPGFARRVLR